MPHLCIVLSNVFVFGAQWELCMGIEASVGGCSSTVNYCKLCWLQWRHDM